MVSPRWLATNGSLCKLQEEPSSFCLTETEPRVGLWFKGSGRGGTFTRRGARREAQGREDVRQGSGRLEPDPLGSSRVRMVSELILLNTRLAGSQGLADICQERGWCRCSLLGEVAVS